MMKQFSHISAYALIPLAFLIMIMTLNSISWGHGEGGEIELQCESPRGDTLKLTINGGREFAEPGEVYGFDIETINAERCQKVEVTFINSDKVRHAFMVDGLSPAFMIELPAQGQKTASFIAPDIDVTLLLHCHVPGHDRAGMSGMAVIGNGDNDFVSTNISSDGGSLISLWVLASVFAVSSLVGSIVFWFWTRKRLRFAEV